MKAKDIRNLIITLLIIAGGVKLIMIITNNAIKNYSVGGLESIINMLTGVGDLIIYGVVFLAIILIPIYLGKRSGEKNVVPDRSGSMGRK